MGKMLDFMNKHNPEAFYCRFQKKKEILYSVDPSIFYNHLKNWCPKTATPVDESPNDNNNTEFDELDCENTEKEIFDAIKELNRKKSLGNDLLLNEYSIYFYLISAICSTEYSKLVFFTTHRMSL